MPTQGYEIVGSYNNQRIMDIDAERSINCFEYIDPLGKKPKALLGTSGIVNTQISLPGVTGGYRQQFVFNNFEYGVIGNKIVRVAPDGTTLIGNLTLDTTSGYVGVAANTFQILFVDGVKGYIWDTNSNVTVVITDPSFPANPLDACYIDGFFLVAHGETNLFELSSFNQGLIWGAGQLTFAPADVNTGTDVITLSSNLSFQTGTPIEFTNSGGTLPAPLAADVTYYAIAVPSSTTQIKVATTAANAYIGTAIHLTTQGTGTHTIDNLGELQQGSITSDTGTIVACRTLHRRVFLFSQFFTEVWQNAGIGTNLPLRRVDSLLIEYGTASAGSISVGFDRLNFLSQDRDGLGPVMEVLGAQPIPISNRALDFQLAQYAASNQISDCRAFFIKENGLIFYRMNFTAANQTFVYNVSLSNPTKEELKLWHEEEVLNGDRHPGQTHSYLNGNNYVGDYKSPIRYRVDSQIYTNNGQFIRRARIGRPIVNDAYNRLRVDRFQVDFLQGNASQKPINGPGEPKQPQLYLSISKDGGETYGAKLPSPIGVEGNNTARTLWRKLGVVPRGQAFVPKIEFWGAMPFGILGASWSFEILPE